jgi:hypothetical protein
MVNAVRGEVAIVLGDKEYVAALNFGATAAVEAAFGLDNFEQAVRFPGGISAVWLRKFITVVLGANGVDVNDPAVVSGLDRILMHEALLFMATLLERGGYTDKASPATEPEEAPLAAGNGGEPG